MLLSDFDYILPEELVAQHPLVERDLARLLVHVPDHPIRHLLFKDIVDLLHPDDVLVINDSRVISCRLYGRRSSSPGHVEVFLVKKIDAFHWHVLVRPLRKFKKGIKILLPDGLEAEFLEFHVEKDIHLIRLNRDISYAELDRFALTPLPPYIKRDKKKIDTKLREEDAFFYQTVYAKEYGSVAAPTAGLHFTEELLKRIAEKGIRIAPVTLEVSLGTFKPVETGNIENHVMHAERFHVSQESAKIINERKGRLVCIGTTSLRVVESLATQDASISSGTGETSIFITPGYEFKACDVLVTNFHLPKSTLLMLVAAFTGMEAMKFIYKTAIDGKYRFYSFGDATWLERKMR